MDALRVSLIVVGILLVVAIYLYGRRQLDANDHRLKLTPSIPWAALLARFKFKRPRLRPVPARPNTPRLEPELSSEELHELDSMVPDRHASLVDVADDVSLIVELTSDQIAPEGEQLFIPLTIVGRHDRRINGSALRLAVAECSFVLKDTGIYYYEVADAQGYKQNLLGLANIIEPGTFDEETIESMETPGLVLFLHLPAPLEARDAFDILLKQGRQLALLLEAELCDDARNALTNQSVSHLKERVEAYRFKQKMTQIKHRRN